ncbi:hypothetical protein [Halarcobacter sp.]|uniref:hypothetical protein n=1 Tax=Halarcobacter sp. TaxID=2321133 RepID=UPI002AA70BA7|nr:hypothetical protein [Halarcobacter sp.]
MFSNIKLFFILSICISFFMGFFFDKIYFKDTEKAIENISMNKIENKKNEDSKNTYLMEKEIVKSIELPTFIKNDIEKFHITTNDFTQKDWEKFLYLYSKKYLKEEINKNFFRNTPFHVIATGFYNFNDIKKMLEEGFDINQKNSKGESPLMLAFKSNNILVIKEFIKMGAIPDENCLLYALKNSNKYTKKASINILKQYGIQLDNVKFFDVANSIENKEYLHELIENIDVNTQVKENSYISLFEDMLLQNHDNKTISKFLNNGVKFEKKDGFNSLHALVTNNNISNENIQKIIDMGENVNEVFYNGTGNTPLLRAMAFANVVDINKIDTLLKNGADMNVVNKKGNGVYEYLDRVKDEDKKNKIIEILNKYK